MFVYLALRDGLWVLTGPPDDPAAARRLTGVDPECVTVHPDEPRRVLVGTVEDGLHRSVDGGDTFERVGERTLASPFVTAVAVNPRDPDEWYVGTEPSAVYRSTDGGATWVRRPGLTDLPSASGWSFPPRPHTHHVRWIEIDPHDPARLYVAIEAGALVRSPDRGETWTDRVPSSRRDNHSLATHPDAPGRVYAAAGDGYAETTDGGETWTYPQSGLDHRYCWSLAVDPGAPDTRLVSAARGAYAAHRVATAESYVYRTGGVGDVEWERVEAGLPTGEGVTRPLLAAGGPGEFYAASNRGLFRSGDAGNSFERVPADLAGVESGPVRGLAVVYE